jgi:hypothetical protein
VEPFAEKTNEKQHALEPGDTSPEWNGGALEQTKCNESAFQHHFAFFYFSRLNNITKFIVDIIFCTNVLLLCIKSVFVQSTELDVDIPLS